MDFDSYNLLDRCSRGIFAPEKASFIHFMTYCSLLKNGLGYKGIFVEIISLKECSDNICLEGELSVANIISSKNTSPFKFKISLSEENKLPQLFADFIEMPIKVFYDDFTNLVSNKFISPLSDLVLSTSGIQGSSLELNSIGICTNPISIYFDGVALIKGFSLNFGAFVNFQDSQLGFMFIFSTAFLNTIQDKIFGASLAPYMRLLEFKSCYLTIALPSKTEIKLPSPIVWPSKKSKIAAGVSISLSAVIVENSKNPVFKFIRNVFGQQTLTFSVSFTDSKIKIGFNLEKVKLTSKVALEEPGVIISADLDAGTVKAELLLNFHYTGNKNDVVFEASVGIVLGTELSFVLSFLMRGIWNRPFGLNDVTISDVGGNIGVTPVPPFISEIGLLGTLQINQIKGKISINLDLNDYEKDFFYCEMEGLTIGKLIEVYGKPIDGLPHIVSNSAFNKFVWSFAFKELINVSGETINEGVKDFGNINFLGFVAIANMKVNSKNFAISIKLPQIKLFEDKVVIQESDTSPSGIFISVNVNLPNFAVLTLAGSAYFKFPLFAISCKYFISNDAFIFLSSVKISTFNCDVSATVLLSNGGSFTAAINDGGFASLISNAFVSQVDKIDYAIPSIVSSSSISDLKNELKQFARDYSGGIKVSFGGALTITSNYFTFNASFGNLKSITFSCTLAADSIINNLIDEFTKDVSNLAKDKINKLYADQVMINKANGRDEYGNKIKKQVCKKTAGINVCSWF